MRYQQLGNSDLSLSSVCLGMWAASGIGWGSVDLDEVARAARVAVAELGVNAFDTADIYGLGESETMLSRALEGIRSNCAIITKVGFRQNELGRHWVDLRPDYVARALEHSLQRLDTDYVDVLLAHGPDADTPLHEMAWAFENLREAGKIRWWGAVNFDQDAIAGLALYPGFVAYQGKLNLLDRGALDDVLPACHAAGVGFMAYSPLAMGLLTGKYRQRAVFGGGDFRSHSSHFTEEGFAAAQHGIATLRRSAWAHGVSMTQMAMAWTLHMGAGHTIVGFKTEEQMRENVGAGEVLLTEHDVRRLLEAFRVDSESVDEDEETLWLT